MRRRETRGRSLPESPGDFMTAKIVHDRARGRLPVLAARREASLAAGGGTLRAPRIEERCGNTPTRRSQRLDYVRGGGRKLCGIPIVLSELPRTHWSLGISGTHA